MELTVCICTYNRHRLLEIALAALAEARPPVGAWEVLVVDNNSTDRTAEVASAFAARLPLRYIVEPTQGLSHARNRACAECRGELLVFTDDDVRVGREWMRAFVDAARDAPEVDFLGGRVLPDWTSGRPAWLQDEDLALLSGLIVKYDLGPQSRHLAASDPLPFGASFAIRRRLFENLSPFRPDLGVSGSNPGRGEEAEFLERARDGGSSGAYVAEAVCYHRVDPARFRPAYLFRFGREKGIAEARIHGAISPRSSLFLQAGFLLRGIAQLLRGRGDRFRQCLINVGILAGLRRETRRASAGRR